MDSKHISFENPLSKLNEPEVVATKTGIYEEAVKMGEELIRKPLAGGGTDRILVQHSKDRMTVWERIKVLTDKEPNIFTKTGERI